MFHTIPQAEFRVPRALLAEGEQVWRWVEIGTNSPLFLATVRHTLEEDSVLHQDFMFSEVEALTHLTQENSTGAELVRVALFSPGYVNKTGAYQLHQLDEIWRDLDSSGLRFVLADGTSMDYHVPMSKKKKRLERVFVAPTRQTGD